LPFFACISVDEIGDVCKHAIATVGELSTKVTDAGGGYGFDVAGAGEDDE
jgi:hypothetical protein